MMKIGPRSPDAQNQLPMGAKARLSQKFSDFFDKIGHEVLRVFAEIRLFFSPTSILSDELKRDIVHIQLGPHELLPLDPTKKENNELKQAFIDYVKKLIEENKTKGPVAKFVSTSKKILEQMYTEGGPQQKQFREESLPLILSNLLVSQQLAESTMFAYLCPFTPGGNIQLDRVKDSALIKALEPAMTEKAVKAVSGLARGVVSSAKSTLAYVYSFYKSDGNTREDDVIENDAATLSEPEELQEEDDKVFVSIEKLRQHLVNNEELRALIERTIRDEIKTEGGQRKAEILIKLMSLPEDDLLGPKSQQSILDVIHQIILPKILDRCLQSLQKIDSLPVVFDKVVGTLKEHADFVERVEKKMEIEQTVIQELRVALCEVEDLNTIENSSGKLRMALIVWGINLVESNTIEERKAFFASDISAIREENYLTKFRYEALGSSPEAFARDDLDWARDALRNKTKLAGKEAEFEKICLEVWGRRGDELLAAEPRELESIFNEAGYKKHLKQKMSTEVGRILSDYFSSQLTPSLILEIITDIQMNSPENWKHLTETFPLLEDLPKQLKRQEDIEALKRQVQTDDVKKHIETLKGLKNEEKLDFMPLVTAGLPLLISGGIESAVNSTDFLEISNVEKIIDESVLPTSIITVHAILLDNILRQDLETLGHVLLDKKLDNDLIDIVEQQYLALVEKEELDIPPELNIRKGLKTTLHKLRDQLGPILEQIRDKSFEEKTVALREALKVFFSPNPSEVKEVYPELALSLLFDLGEQSNALKYVLRNSPIYSPVATQLSRIITSSLYPFRIGHRETVRKLAGVFTKLTHEVIPFVVRIPVVKGLKFSPEEMKRLSQNFNVDDGNIRFTTKEIIISFPAEKAWIEQQTTKPTQELLELLHLGEMIPKLNASFLQSNLPFTETVPFELRIPKREDIKLLPILFSETAILNNTLQIKDGQVRVVNNEIVITFGAGKNWLEENSQKSVEDVLKSFGLTGLIPDLNAEFLKSSLRQKLISEKVRKIARTTLAMAKINLGIKGKNSLKEKAFKYILPESRVLRLIDRVMKKLIFQDSTYHFRAIEEIAKQRPIRGDA